ncbi:hypothetical protein RJ035_005775 [Blastomyces gilchristii]
MATRLILGTHAINTLMEQAKRFEAMSVQFAKSADLATSQAAEISKWTSKLMYAVTKIQQEAEAAAAACRKRVEERVHELKTKADSHKRKLSIAAELESPRTVKANLRLIFGPPREAAYKSKSTKALMATSSVRIHTIRSLCRKHPHGVITFVTAYPTKVWTESSLEVFKGLIKLVEEEQEQDWPDDIVEIMDELEKERPMSDEFKYLRAEISQHTYQRRRRVGDTGRPAQVGRISSQPYGQGTARTNPQGIPHLPLLNERENLGPPDPSKENREMKHMYTNSPAEGISNLPEPFKTAVQNSRLWEWERSQGMDTTGCWASLFPKDNRQDVSFTIWCGNDDGYRLNNIFGSELTISS